MDILQAARQRSLDGSARRDELTQPKEKKTDVQRKKMQVKSVFVATTVKAEVGKWKRPPKKSRQDVIAQLELLHRLNMRYLRKPLQHVVPYVPSYGNVKPHTDGKIWATNQKSGSANPPL